MENKYTVIIDTREKANKHVVNYLTHRKIPFVSRALKFGDYSIEVNGVSLENKVYIERKGLDEICGNLGKHRDRFHREFERGKHATGYIMIEGASYSDIVTGNYRSKFNNKALLGSINSFEVEHNVTVNFVDKKEHVGNYIFYKLKAYANKYLQDLEEAGF